ncbi:enolase C-terminal domain-like protein [Virgisporangium aurantiacum]|uniref:Mandelate racemase n=1 Tax=Virgisporangium aurantiacum TaxID=175570 RepID=A0A8J4DY56_9ACTN|nr:enolase C-terminal domain-like protein [Virgisporangium aurantiacum]GIJ54281.1 mandelate racemase [Virgisporangium aurantiacum]
MPTITAIDVVDVRFPTARVRPGCPPTHPDREHSVAYVAIWTSTELAGHGLAFTIGRDNPVCVAAARRVAAPLLGRDVDDVAASLGTTYRQLVEAGEPDAGTAVVRLATAAVLTAVWDLVARRAGKPVWRLVSEMEPTELVAACDFGPLSDALPRQEAVEMLERLAPTRAQRVRHLAQVGYPAYTSVPGPPGHTDAQLRTFYENAVADGWHAVKVEVGGNVGGVRRRLAAARAALGPDATLLVDARHRWDVKEAIHHGTELAEFGPLWIEEPTDPDDVAGHASIRAALSPVGVATVGSCHSRVMVKRMVEARAVDCCRIDPGRLVSVNEIVPVLLLAAKFGVPVCYPGDGVGLSELVQHIAMIDFICVSGSMVGRLIEHVDVLHEHFSSPAVVEGAWHRPPTDPGYSARMQPESLATYRYPDGAYWREAAARR